MKIYLNTNKELIGQEINGLLRVDEIISKDTLECDLDQTWLNDIDQNGGIEYQRKIQELDDEEVEIEFDSNFSNWQGGKHCQFKKAGLTGLWVSHKEMPKEIEDKIDRIILQELDRTKEVLWDLEK